MLFRRHGQHSLPPRSARSTATLCLMLCSASQPRARCCSGQASYEPDADHGGSSMSGCPPRQKQQCSGFHWVDSSKVGQERVMERSTSSSTTERGDERWRSGKIVGDVMRAKIGKEAREKWMPEERMRLLGVKSGVLRAVSSTALPYASNANVHDSTRVTPTKQPRYPSCEMHARFRPGPPPLKPC